MPGALGKLSSRHWSALWRVRVRLTRRRTHKLRPQARQPIASGDRDGVSHNNHSMPGVVDLHSPPPDAEGNPACNYRDGWEADPSGSAINVYYFREPRRRPVPRK